MQLKSDSKIIVYLVQFSLQLILLCSILSYVKYFNIRALNEFKITNLCSGTTFTYMNNRILLLLFLLNLIINNLSSSFQNNNSILTWVPVHPFVKLHDFGTIL